MWVVYEELTERKFCWLNIPLTNYLGSFFALLANIVHLSQSHGKLLSSIAACHLTVDINLSQLHLNHLFSAMNTGVHFCSKYRLSHPIFLDWLKQKASDKILLKIYLWNIHWIAAFFINGCLLLKWSAFQKAAQKLTHGIVKPHCRPLFPINFLSPIHLDSNQMCLLVFFTHFDYCQIH